MDVLSFGSEIADLSLIEALATLRENEPKSVSDGVRRGLSEGLTYSRAWGVAASEYLGVDAEALNRPNLILATEYVRELRAQGLSMEAVPIPRQGDYHGEALGEYASASAIRAAFARGDSEATLQCLPEPARVLPDKLHPMDDLLLYRLREMSMEQMAALPDMSEGLEHRLYRLCRTAATRQALLEAMKCKRYTHARLGRMLTHAALGMTRSTLEANPMPTYARLLGMRRDAEPLIRALNARATIPIVSDPKRLRDDPIFRLECRATDFWALMHDLPEHRLPGREFTEKFILI